MSTYTKTGGQAFPRADQYGMSMRDYFAAKALPSCIEHWNVFNRTHEDGDGSDNEFTSDPIALMAADAYEIADAMLRAGGKV